jgi:type II restriction/modification system DNA methylase subunit YeeA
VEQSRQLLNRRELSNVKHRDAIMRYEENEKSEEHPNGRPYEPEWPETDYIVGNPPFLGGSQMRSGRPATKKTPAVSGLGDAYVDDLRALYKMRVPGGADLVTYWFEKTRALVAKGEVARAGLIATQSIRAGANRKVLKRIKEGCNIFMAWSDRPWVLDGADVRVSLIAFDNGSEEVTRLNDAVVRSIHENLTAGSNASDARILVENSDLGFKGFEKNGEFEITNDIGRKMLAAPVNVNGRPNSDVVQRWMNHHDVTMRNRGMFIVDFGCSMSEKQAAEYEWPFEWAKTHVYGERLKNKDPQRRIRWWRFGRSGKSLRKALANKQRFIATGRVSKHRTFAWIPKGTVPDSRLYVFARDDDYFFGVLQSRLHEEWSLRTSSRHGVGNDPTYNGETCFETFPFPYAPGTEPSEADSPIVRAVADAARELVRLRDAWLNPLSASDDDLKSRTLTKLYNARPEWLANAHRTLDEAVFAAYGWPPNLTDQEILAHLLALNHERAALQSQTTR